MGYFDLPTGELELMIDGEWKSVSFTDRPDMKEVMADVEMWSKKHEVTKARYNSHRYTNEIPVIVWEKGN